MDALVFFICVNEPHAAIVKKSGRAKVDADLAKNQSASTHKGISMHTLFKRLFAAVACTLFLGLWAGTAAHAASSYPSRPIRLIVPWSAGGSTDLLGRVLAQSMGARLHTSIIVENKPGATGTIGYGYVAHSPADGYTLLLGTNSTFAIAPHFYHQLPYDTDKDFAPVGLIGSNAQVLCVPISSPYKTLADLEQAARAQPGMLNFESSGVGGSSHLAMELLMQLTGIDLAHVPYKGGAPALEAMMGKQVQAGFVDISVAAPLVQSHQLRALGTSELHRAPMLPEVPTLSEVGAKGFESTTSYGLFVPAGTPAAVVTELNHTLNAVLTDPAIKKKLFDQGFELTPSTPQAYEKYAVAESQKWGDLIAKRHITLP